MDICLVTNRVVDGDAQGEISYEIVRRAAEVGHRVTCVAHDVSPDLHVRPHVSWALMPDAERPLALLGTLRFAWHSTRWLRSHGEPFDIIVGIRCVTWYPLDLNIVPVVRSAQTQSAAHDSRRQSGPHGWTQWLYSFLNARLEASFLPRADVTVATSQRVKHDLDERGLAQGPIRVIRNEVNPEDPGPNPANHRAPSGSAVAEQCLELMEEIASPDPQSVPS